MTIKNLSFAFYFLFVGFYIGGCSPHGASQVLSSPVTSPTTEETQNPTSPTSPTGKKEASSSEDSSSSGQNNTGASSDNGSTISGSAKTLPIFGFGGVLKIFRLDPNTGNLFFYIPFPLSGAIEVSGILKESPLITYETDKEESALKITLSFSTYPEWSSTQFELGSSGLKGYVDKSSAGIDIFLESKLTSPFPFELSTPITSDQTGQKIGVLSWLPASETRRSGTLISITWPKEFTDQLPTSK